MKKKIVHVIGQMNYGGTEMMIMDIIKESHDKFEYHLIINTKKNQPINGVFDQELVRLGCTLHQIDAVWQNSPVKYIRDFYKIIMSIGDVNVVHNHLNSRNGVIALASKKSNVNKVISHSHANLKFRGSLISRVLNYTELFLERHLINKYSTDYWGCSEDALKSLFNKKNIVSSNCHVINNAIDLKKFNAERSHKNLLRKEFLIDSKYIIGSVGRVAAVKNYDYSINLVRKIIDLGYDVTYVICGEIQDKQLFYKLSSKLKELSLENRVIFTGVMNNIEKVIPNFDVFIAPSLQEGFGIAALESQASGVYSVVSDGFPDLVDMKVDLLTRIDLKDESIWIEKIVNNLERERCNIELVHGVIEKNGFDIKSNIHFITDQYNGK